MPSISSLAPGPDYTGPDLWLEEGRPALYVPLQQSRQQGTAPNWDKLAADCISYTKASLDLRVLVLLTLCWTQKRGYAGLSDGLKLIGDAVESYPTQVHPHTEAGDEQERVAAMSPLNEKLGSVTPYRFAWTVWKAPLITLKSGSLSWSEIKSAPETAPPESDPAKVVLTQANLAQAIKDLKGPAVAEAVGHLSACVAQVARLTGLLPHARPPLQLSGLATALSEPLEYLNRLAPAPAPLVVPRPAPIDQTQIPKLDPTTGIMLPAVLVQNPGPIRSRQDVELILKQVEDFLAQTEPSSPVPYLLKRARRMLGMSFAEALQELAPASVESICVPLGLTKPNPS